MRTTTRRGFIGNTLMTAGGLCAVGLSRSARIGAAEPTKKSDIRIERVSHRFTEHVFRTPLKFAQAVVERQTMLTVDCTVKTAAGQVATGFGTLPLNYTFT